MIVSSGAALDFAPQALGESVPMAAATGYYYADQGVPLLNSFALYGQMYRGQPWLATVVDKVANSAARLSFNSWDNSGAQKMRDTDSPFAKLWKRPCPLMPRYSFWRWTFSTYEVYGEAFWLKLRGPDGRVVGLFPMHPSRTVVKRLLPKEQADLGYRTNIQYIFSLGVASAGLLEVSEDDVVPFLRYNPDNLMRGLSRVEPLRSTLYNEDASRRAVESWWKRGARPSLMISAPGALGQTAYDRLKATVEKVHGGADQMGGTLLLEEGAKPVPVQLSAEEMQYIQSRVLNREEVCGVYDVPPPVIHILDHATFSNITEQMRSMYRDTMAPRLEDVESTIEHHLTIPDFGSSGEVEGRFALDEVLRGDFETRATAVGSLVEKGVMKPSEARPLFDLDDAGPVANKLYANSALQELGTPATRITVTDRTAVATPGEQEAASEANEAVANEIDSQAADRKPPVKNVARSRDRSERRAAERRGQWRKDDTEEAS